MYSCNILETLISELGNVEKIIYCNYLFFDSLLNQKPNQPCSKVEKQLSQKLQKLPLFTYRQIQHWLRDNKNFTNRLVDRYKNNLQETNLKPWPNATLLGATCCACLATVFQFVLICWVLLAQIWPFSNMLRPTMLRYVALTCCDRLARA